MRFWFKADTGSPVDLPSHARHEAGHIVTLEHAGVPVTRAEVTAQGGFTDFPDPAPGDQLGHEGRAVAALAGREAQVDWLERVRGQGRGEALAATNHGCSDDRAAFDQLSSVTGISEAEARAQAQRIIREHRAEIERTAESLLAPQRQPEPDGRGTSQLERTIPEPVADPAVPVRTTSPVRESAPVREVAPAPAREVTTVQEEAVPAAPPERAVRTSDAALAQAWVERLRAPGTVQARGEYFADGGGGACAVGHARLLPGGHGENGSRDDDPNYQRLRARYGQRFMDRVEDNNDRLGVPLPRIADQIERREKSRFAW